MKNVSKNQILQIIGMFIMAVLFGVSAYWCLNKMLLVSVPLSIVYSLIATYILFTVLFLATKDAKEKINPKTIILHVIGAGLAPSIILFLYTSKNLEQFQFSDCLIVAATLFCISVGLLFAFSKTVDFNNATLPLLTVWALFWLYPYYPANGKAILNILYIVIGTIFVTALLLVLKKHGFDRNTGIILSTVICILFCYNFACCVYTYAKEDMNRNAYQGKKTFLTDSKPKRPNVYWLHMDGMIGFDTVSKVFSENQDDFRRTLTNAGFVINESARLDIGWTAYAFPALTSPTLYESYIKGLFDGMQDMTDHERQDTLKTSFSVFNLYNDLDLFHAFEAGGYENYCLIHDLGRGTENIPKDYRYKNAFSIDKTANLIDLFSNHSLLKVFKRELDRVYNRHLSFVDAVVHHDEIYAYTNPKSDYLFKTIPHYDWTLANDFEELLKLEGPKLVYIQNLLPHFPYNHDENGLEIPQNGDHDLSNYFSQHSYAIQVLLGMVKRILSSDSDAVIIIQGDHGAHYFERKDFRSQGYTDDEMLELNYSTVSAVRIPEKYGSLTEPLDPLDITRYLVNHFVGEGNYDYLHYYEEE